MLEEKKDEEHEAWIKKVQRLGYLYIKAIDFK